MRRFGPLILLFIGCGLPLDTNQRVPTFPLFDPDSGEIPMPNDALRDEGTGRLDLPTDDDDLTPADRAFREWLNTRDGWATTLPATVRFSDAIDSATVDEDNVQIWDWNDGDAFRFTDVRVVIDEDDRRLQMLPPRTGWERGHTYLVVVRGGTGGVRDAHGFGLEPDAIFYFLKRSQRLDTVGHNRAFPGATRAERLDNGRRLEDLRVELAPFFDFFEDPARPAESEIPREEIAALWSFTVTTSPELAMDRDSQRVPLPFDLLIDPETGFVNLEEADWDTALEADAKRQASELRGFGVSANLHWEATEAVDATSLPGRVHVFETGTGIRDLPITTHVLGEAGEAACAITPTPIDCTHVIIEIADEELPLRPSTTYAIVVDRGVRAASGEELEVMPIGFFMRTEHELAVDGVSQLGSLTDALANRLEVTRARIAPLLDGYGRDNIITAWPFTTMDAVPGVREAARMTIDLGLDTPPTVVERLPPLQALEALFPGIESSLIRLLYLPRTQGVQEFVIGTLPSPYFLDPVTRRWSESGEYEMEDVRFYLSIPEGADPSEPLPVVIFGHAIVTDARFMMTVAGEYARRGFATLSIDFPFHGDRIDCIDASLVAIPNFFPEQIRNVTGLTDDILRFPPCSSGSDARCSPEGECITASGAPDTFTAFPLVAVQVASGAAFLDVGDLPFITDHFRQALVDLSTLLHAIQTQDWGRAVGIDLDPERVLYTGQSLGAIIGAVWVSVTPEIDRAVLNVPGADMVDLFRESTYFAPQIDAYFDDIEVANPSYEKERLLDVARWLIDSVDPHSVAHLYAEDDRAVLLQMDRGDIIIPNRTTETLQRVSGRPMRTYPSFLHADLVVPVIGDTQLSEMGQFLSGEIDR
ncbi:MAG: hypothetical protein H6719_28570 [Sandaracinaceae bacterium]|nr:hypothetical protein [Sandaracinaceae bacterium]